MAILLIFAALGLLANALIGDNDSSARMLSVIVSVVLSVMGMALGLLNLGAALLVILLGCGVGTWLDSWTARRKARSGKNTDAPAIGEHTWTCYNCGTVNHDRAYCDSCNTRRDWSNKKHIEKKENILDT